MELRAFREKKGLNQRELAELMHTAQSLVSSVETGRLKPWPLFMRRASEALSVDVAELFPEVGNNERKN